jgi:hypothetical protein
MTAPVGTIHQTRVIRTYIAGELVWSSKKCQAVTTPPCS